MYKKVLSILLVIAFCVSCSTGDLVVQREAVPSKTIIDSIGREVEVPLEINKVACLFTNTGHIITMLGHGDTIVAVSNGLKRDKLLHQIEPVIADASLVKVSGSVNFEEILKCEVDLMLLPSDMYQDDELIKQLDKYKIPYVITEFNSIKDQKDLVTLIGEIFDEAEEAANYNTLYDEILSEIDQVEIKDSDRVRVYHSVNEATNTVPSDSLPGEWLAISGGDEVTNDNVLVQDKEKYYASLEQIIQWNPEVILCNEDGVDEYIRTKDQWASLQAVQNDKVYLMPTGISRWGHTTSIETPLAIIWTAKTLYPDLFDHIDLEDYTKRFYKDLFEFDLSDESYNDILIGKGMRLEKDLSEPEASDE